MHGVIKPTAAGLALDAVEVSFGGLKAIGGVSLTVAPGEFVGIVGPNGAGKSTLIQAITGFVRPTGGSIAFDGQRLDGLAPEEIAALGVGRTFQTSRVFPALTIGESVRVGTQRALIGGGRVGRRFGALAEPVCALLGLSGYRRGAAECDERAEEVLKLFGDRLWPRRDQPTHSLSYANRRRLDIARALATAPDLLLLDEPTAGMNPTESHELADLLIDVRRRFPAMAIVMVEHKLDIVRKLTRRTVVMAQGQVIVDDEPDRAFDHPEVTAAYLGQGTGGRGRAVVAGHLDHAPEAGMPGPEESPAIELDGVDVYYGPIQALFGVSLRVGRGESVAVLGGNASGKSTTVKTVLRLVTPRKGEVRLYGTPLATRTTAGVIEQNVASIPEGRRMFAELTVRENMLMGAYARRRLPRTVIERDVERAIAEFPWLGERLDQLAGTLSGGEQQMVAMARAWLRKPQILCIDEPSMGLSPLMVDRVYEILARWKSQGLTILMVEQSANRALELVDRAYVLRNGAVIMEGRAEDLRENPAVREAYLGGAHAAPTPLRRATRPPPLTDPGTRPERPGSSQMGLRVGVDIGGTFTDFALLDPDTGQFEIGKVLSTPSDPAEAVIEGLRARMAESGRSMAEIGEVIHATTIATNTVIQRKGPPTALITTKGFRDVILIGRQKRYELYDNLAGRPAPLVPRDFVFEVAERMLWTGEVETALDEAGARAIARELAARGVVAAAVCFLHSYANPAHEKRVAEILREEAPDLMVSISCEVSPLYREFERTSTTVMNAYVMPGVARYVERLDGELRAMGTRAPMLVMQSNGGVATADTVKRFPIRIIESGPAAGVLTAARFAPAAGTDNLISFDMGGTTAKLCLVENGKPLLTSQFEVDMTRLKKGSGLPVSIPAVDLVEIGSGGGSIAKVALGAIAVGPESAGSVPGPACYGRGGTLPTVTDADLVLGYLDPDYFLGGEMKLDTEAALTAIDRHVAVPLGIDVMQAAWGIHEIVTAQMAQAARAVTINCGKDPRLFALVPFGGAGPVHGARLARMLGCPRLVFPRAAGVESAVGLLMAETSLDLARTQVLDLDAAAIEPINALYADLEEQARRQLDEAGVPRARQSFSASCDMRFAGQGFEIAVDLPPPPYAATDLARLRAAFHGAYAKTYGDRTFDPGWTIVAVHWRLRATATGKTLAMDALPILPGGVERARRSQRQVWFPEAEGFALCTVYDRYRLSAGDVIAGPAIVEERESTIVLPPGSETVADAHGNLVTTLN